MSALDSTRSTNPAAAALAQAGQKRAESDSMFSVLLGALEGGGDIDKLTKAVQGPLGKEAAQNLRDAKATGGPGFLQAMEMTLTQMAGVQGFAPDQLTQLLSAAGLVAMQKLADAPAAPAGTAAARPADPDTQQGARAMAAAAGGSRAAAIQAALPAVAAPAVAAPAAPKLSAEDAAVLQQSFGVEPSAAPARSEAGIPAPVSAQERAEILEGFGGPAAPAAPAAAAAPAPLKPGTPVKVAPGDTMTKLAQGYTMPNGKKVTIEDLSRVPGNEKIFARDASGGKIQIGESLVMPEGATKTSTPGGVRVGLNKGTPASIAEAANTSAATRADQLHGALTNPNILESAKGQAFWAVTGPLSGPDRKSLVDAYDKKHGGGAFERDVLAGIPKADHNTFKQVFPAPAAPAAGGVKNNIANKAPAKAEAGAAIDYGDALTQMQGTPLSPSAAATGAAPKAAKAPAGAAGAAEAIDYSQAATDMNGTAIKTVANLKTDPKPTTVTGPARSTDAAPVAMNAAATAKPSTATVVGQLHTMLTDPKINQKTQGEAFWLVAGQLNQAGEPKAVADAYDKKHGKGAFERHALAALPADQHAHVKTFFGR